MTLWRGTFYALIREEREQEKSGEMHGTKIPGWTGNILIYSYSYSTIFKSPENPEANH